MDTTTSMKALLVAMQQYEGGRNSHSAAQLLKQVEEVSALKCDHLLSSGQLLHTECVRGLVELTGNVNTCPNVAGAILSLLSQLAACDDNSRTMLHYNFNLTSVLALLIHRLRATPGDPLVLQSLQLLQKLTYSTHNFPSTSYLHEFIAFLMTNIQSQSDEVVMPYLGLMANLCRDNQAVQNHVKSLDNVKPFYRTLINFLAHNNLTLVMFSLSILASLTLSENAGEKVFGAKNIHQTFQLVFNIILNCDGTLTRKYSADLLVDLLHNPKIADCLTRFQYFSVCASQLFGLLKSKDIDSAAKVLELLLAMCCVSGLRPLLCQVLFKPVGPKLRVASRRQAAGLEHKAESTLALVHWLSLPMGDAEACSLQVLQLIKELLEEALSAVSMPEGVHVFLEMLLPVILDFVKGLDVPANDAHLRQHCERIIHVNRVLLVLCGDDTTRALVSHRVSSQLCLSQVEMLLACCHGNSLLAWLPPGADHSLSQVCAEALLSTLELMSKLRQQVSDMETSFYRTLQDQRIATPLALALTSHQREHVRTGFALLLEAMPLPDFPSLVLSESVATNNAYRQSEAKLCVKRVPVQDVQPPCMNASQMDVSTSSSSVHSLVEKLHSAMELQEQAKDGHVSDIIDVYEHKLAALASEESRLQDLLEAKAVALSQADRLLAQHHFQRAQAEAEARKLASLLKEAERRRESLQAELVVQLEEAQRSKAETEELLQHNSRLQLASEEHQALKDTYNSLLHKFNEGECLLKKLQTAHATLNQTNQALRKNHQVLQLQHDKTVLLLQDKEEEITSLRSDMRLKDDDIAALRGDLREAEDKGREKELQKQELEDTLDALRKELSKTEQARKDASIKASSLQLQKSQLEAKLKQREDELNEHSAMIAMIHSMSSGKKKDVNFSL